MAPMTVDTIPTYRLRPDTLLDYLRSIFPNHAITVQVSIPHHDLVLARRSLPDTFLQYEQ